MMEHHALPGYAAGMPSASTRKESPLLVAARDYATRGWQVFPLHAPAPGGGCSCEQECTNIGKHPRTKNGFKDASAREETITGWWKRWPSANVGIATGACSGLLVLDIDTPKGGDDSLARLLDDQDATLPATLTALTGGGGQHRLFAHPSAIYLGNENGGRGRFAAYPGLDVRGDGGYIVAAPSMHASGARYEWQDAEAPVAPLPPWLITMLTQPRGDDGLSATARERDFSDTSAREAGEYWLSKALASASEGNRNQTGFDLACQLRDAGLSEDAATDFIVTYAERVPGTGYGVREALASLRQAYARTAREPARSSTSRAKPTGDPQRAPFAPDVSREDGSNGHHREYQREEQYEQRHEQAHEETKRKRFTFMSDLELEHQPPPKWLVGTVLVENTLSTVFGDYGSHKSFLVLDWGLCCAAGVPWNGHPVKQGHVVYIAGEGSAGLNNRIRAWKIAHKLQGVSLPIHVLSVAPQLLRGGDIAELIAAIKELPEAPVLIIVDTLARAMVGGDENSQKDMGLAIASADNLREAFGAHVIFVHHKPKQASGPRGSNALPGACNTTIDVIFDGNKLVTVKCEKQKDHPPFRQMLFERRSYALDEEGEETSLVLVPRAGTATNAQDRMLSALRVLGRRATYTEWQAEVERAGIPKRTFDYNLKVLVTTRAVLQDDKHYVAVEDDNG